MSDPTEPESSARVPLVELNSLCKHFPIRHGIWGRVEGHVRAVDGVSLQVQEGETLGVVGEAVGLVQIVEELSLDGQLFLTSVLLLDLDLAVGIVLRVDPQGVGLDAHVGVLGDEDHLARTRCLVVEGARDRQDLVVCVVLRIGPYPVHR